MPRPRALLLGLWLPLLACDSKAVEAQTAHIQALEGRLQRVEAEAAALTARVKLLEDERLRQPPPQPPAGAAANIVVEVTADGLRVGDETVDLDRFQALLRERLVARPDLSLHVKADTSVEYARVIEVMDRAKAAGVAKIAMVADPALKR
ncbi:ExbD/TolR family protein [Nannocystis exedens]|nr:biopolymer transporter ExbD [Nannocystis exedens]